MKEKKRGLLVAEESRFIPGRGCGVHLEEEHCRGSDGGVGRGLEERDHAWEAWWVGTGRQWSILLESLLGILFNSINFSLSPTA